MTNPSSGPPCLSDMAESGWGREGQIPYLPELGKYRSPALGGGGGEQASHPPPGQNDNHLWIRYLQYMRGR